MLPAPPMRDNRTAAVSLAEQGYTILPCLPGEKRPVGRLVPHGFHDASKDPAVVDRWWSVDPTFNIGIVTGLINGFVVADVDHDAGADEDDYPMDWAKTKVVITPHGAHLYYLITGPQQSYREVAGIGLKSDGGYVIAPPSFTDNSYELFRDRPLQPLPVEWLDRFAPAEVERRQPAKVRERLARQRQGPRRPIRCSVRKYVDAALVDEVRYVERAKEGERNNELYVATVALGQIVATGWLSEGQVYDHLGGAARKVGLGDREIMVTIRSGLAAGSYLPRSF